MAQPNWDMSNWEKGGPITFMEALGFSRQKLTFPKLDTQLTSPSATYQHPLAVAQNPDSPPFGNHKPPTTKQVGSYKQYARRLLVGMKWGNQFTALSNIIMAESSWNPHIKNPSSGAYGIAQANTHHPEDQGTESDMYGGFGLTTKQAKSANSGDGYWQLVWMLDYIKSRYGSPASAWAFHQKNGYY
jgi:hypothetical protein